MFVPLTMYILRVSQASHRAIEEALEAITASSRKTVQWSARSKVAGHDRLVSMLAYQQLDERYQTLRLLVNCFQPAMLPDRITWLPTAHYG